MLARYRRCGLAAGRTLLCCALTTFWLITGSGLHAAQPPEQKATADKFLQIFLNRPQPGTALDKTMDYYQSTGQLDELITQLKSKAEEAQQSEPDLSARHWLALALMAQSQSRWLESVELLKTAPQANQQKWPIAIAQSLAYEQLQRWPSVIETLAPIVPAALDGSAQYSTESTLEAARRLAKAYSRSGKSNEALDLWRKLASRFGSDKQLAIRLASMAADEGELKFAIEVLDRTLVDMPPSNKRFELAIQRTNLLARSGEETAALASYQELLNSLNTDSWLANDVSGRIEDLIVSREGVTGLIGFYQAELKKRPNDVRSMLRTGQVAG